MGILFEAKKIVLEKYPNALSLQGFVWMIYDKPDPPIVQIGRGNSEESAWIDAATEILRQKK